LTEDMIVARTRVNDLACVKKLNCWGADLDDVSVLQRLENVEMLSLSLNSIETLSDFQHCKKLQELFLRKNHINSLRELLWLKNLAKLKNLWLAENPCSEGSGSRYRQTVIHNLPQLEKLDNVAITSQERAEALRFGENIADEEDVGEEEGFCYSDNRRMSIEELEDLRSEMGDQRRYEEQSLQLNQYKESDARNDYHHSNSQYQPQLQGFPRDSEDDRRSSQQSMSLMSRSGSISRLSVSSYNPIISQEPRTNPNPHSEEMYNNNRTSVSLVTNNRSSYYDDCRSTISEYRPSAQYRPPSTTSLFRSSGGGGGVYPDLGRHGGRERGRSRNSNILSSILCLIKEIDIPSLEVVEMAVRCRMEELED